MGAGRETIDERLQSDVGAEQDGRIASKMRALNGHVTIGASGG